MGVRKDFGGDVQRHESKYIPGGIMSHFMHYVRMLTNSLLAGALAGAYVALSCFS